MFSQAKTLIVCSKPWFVGQTSISTAKNGRDYQGSGPRPVTEPTIRCTPAAAFGVPANEYDIRAGTASAWAYPAVSPAARVNHPTKASDCLRVLPFDHSP